MEIPISGVMKLVLGTLLLIVWIRKVQCEKICVRAIPVEDDQFSSSSQFNETYKASTARLNGQGGWMAVGDSTEEYLKLDFKEPHRVIRLILQGAHESYIQVFWLLYSLDGLVWETYVDKNGIKDFVNTERGWDRAFYLKIDPPLQARYIMINPRRSLRLPTLRLEFHGCLAENVTLNKTEVTKDIQEGEVVWSRDESPYIITKEITVSAGSHLIIMYGVKVIFEANAGIIVAGKVSAYGSSSHPVCFWPNQPPFLDGALWNGISVKSSGHFLCVFCDIRQAETGIIASPRSLQLSQTQIYLNEVGLNLIDGDGGSYTYRHLVLTKNRNSGIISSGNWSSSTTVLFSQCEVHGDRTDGITMKSAFDLMVKNCHFVGAGVLTADSTGSLRVDNTTFREHSYGVLANSNFNNILINNSEFVSLNTGLLSYWANASIQVLNSKFYGMTQSGIDLYGSVGILVDSCGFNDSSTGISVHSSRPNSVVVRNSEFDHIQTRAIEVQIVCRDQPGSIILKNNTLQSHSSTQPFRVIMTYTDSYLGKLDLSGNKVSGFNQSSDVIVFPRYRWQDPPGKGKADIKIFNNEFSDNTGTFVLNIKSRGADVLNNTFANNKVHNSTIYFPGLGKLQRNIFVNPKSPFDVETTARASTESFVNGSFNYWGGSSATFVQSRINDYTRNLSKAEVRVDSFYLSKKLESLSEESGSSFMVEDGTTVGGQLQKDLELGPDQVLVVDRFILVPPHVTLLIKPNVTMMFAPKTGITVQGTLITEGSEDRPVILEGDLNTTWQGIYLLNATLRMNYTKMINASGIANPDTNTCSSVINVNIENSELWLDEIMLQSHFYSFKMTSTVLRAGASQFNLCPNDTSNKPSFPTITVQRSNITCAENKTCLDVKSRGQGVGHFINIRQNRVKGGQGISLTSINTTLSLNIENNVIRSQHGAAVTVTGEYDEIAILENVMEAKDDVMSVFIGYKVHPYSPLNDPNYRYSRSDYYTIYVDNRPEKRYRTVTLNTSVAVYDNVITGSKVEVISPYTLASPIEIWNNSINATLVLGTSDVQILENRFVNPTLNFINFTGIIHDVKDISAVKNYWKSQTYATVEMRIKDYKQNTTFPRVHVLPFFLDEGMTLLNDKVKFVSGDVIGGPLGGAVTLSKLETPYTATSDIYVAKEDTLIIEPGVTLLFEEGVNFIVDGSLYLQGTVEQPIELRSKTVGRPWNGLKLGRITYERVRLQGGSREDEGNVFIFTGSRYKEICPYDLDPNLARVVCRMAGYTSVQTANLSTNMAQTSGLNFGYAGVACRGQETDLVECRGGNGFCQRFTTSRLFIRCNSTKARRGEELTEISLQNVLVNDTVSGVTITGNLTKFENVTSQFSRNNGLTFTYEFKGSYLPEIVNTNSLFNGNDGVSIETDRPFYELRFNGCNFKHNRRNGVTLQGYIRAEFVDCSICENMKGLNNDLYYYMNITLRGCNVHNNTHKAVDLKGRDITEDTLSVVNTTFSGHSVKSSDCFVCLHKIKGHVRFIENTFINNTGQVLDINTNGKLLQLELESNTFSNNTGYQIVLLDLKEWSKLIRNVTVNIKNNVFTFNTASSVLSLTWYKRTFNVSLTENEFRFNDVDNTINLESFGSRINNNTFTNPLADCEIRPPSFQQNESTDARWNYWGFDDFHKVQRRVCGLSQNMSWSIVHYFPYTTLKSRAQHATDFISENSIGGEIDSEVVLRSRSRPYIVSQTIWIRKGGRLVVEEGTHLQFKESIGIYCEGELVIRGSGKDTPKTRFGGSSDSGWFGIVATRESSIDLNHCEVFGASLSIASEARLTSVTNCFIHGSATSGIKLGKHAEHLNLTESVVTDNAKYGIESESSNMYMTGGEVRNNRRGGIYYSWSVYHSTDNSTVTISDSLVVDNNGSGISVDFLLYRRDVSVSVMNSNIYNNAKGIFISLARSISSVINIDNCSFSNSTEMAIETKTKSFDLRQNITNNLFTEAGGVQIEESISAQINILGNTANMTSSNKSLFSFEEGRAYYSGENQITFNFMYNNVENCSGLSALNITSKSPVNGSCAYNHFIASRFTGATVVLNAANMTFEHNVFLNEATDLEMVLLKPGGGQPVNASHNWWGSVDLDVVNKRVLDGTDNPSLPKIQFLPFAHNCSDVNYCSLRGVCSSTNQCACWDNWSGPDCSSQN